MIDLFIDDLASVLLWLWRVDWLTFFHTRPGFAVIGLAVGLIFRAICGFGWGGDGGDFSFGGDGGDGGGD